MLDRTNPVSELIHVEDNLLSVERRQEVDEFLRRDGWRFGWKSRGRKDAYSFWHRHFGGYINSGGDETAYDCEYELKPFPIILAAWREVEAILPQKHRLIRCYANGHTYGSDGTLHTDTGLPNTYTTVYYPHDEWRPNWGGETVFFNREKDDIISCIYPRPNRMVIFDGRIPHVARGVSRTCPVLRVTLMFKTDIPDA